MDKHASLHTGPHHHHHHHPKGGAPKGGLAFFFPSPTTIFFVSLSPAAAGFTRQPENSTSTPPKFNERTPRGKKERKLWREMENLGRSDGGRSGGGRSWTEKSMRNIKIKQAAKRVHPETAQKIDFLNRNVTRNREAIEAKKKKTKRREKEQKIGKQHQRGPFHVLCNRTIPPRAVFPKHCVPLLHCANQQHPTQHDESLAISTP